MRNVDEIINGLSEALAPLIREAFEAGRFVGRQDEKRNLWARLADLRPDEAAYPGASDVLPQPDVQERQSVLPEPEAALADRVERRATPGSVKPAILKLIRDNPEGITREDIEERTGFKHNSVRGTLWTLMTDKTISRRGDVFVMSSEELEPAGQEPPKEPPADQGGDEASEQPHTEP